VEHTLFAFGGIIDHVFIGFTVNALSIIQGEHRNLGATLVSFEKLLREIEDQPRESNAMLLRAIISYIESFLYRFHHPKEDDYLFPALSRRNPAAGKLIQELQNDHRKGTELCHKLDETLTRYESNHAGFAEFHEAALVYIKYERRHIGKEEAELLPLAREHLTEFDWKPIDVAFCANDDPMFGDKPKQRYRQLSNLITNVCIFGDPLL
jgi:branched-chain amino acid transport system ATP-binding protein